MTVSVLWVALYFGNDKLLAGGYFHYDWLFWTVLAAVLYRKKLFWLAGAVLAYPAMMRGYPGLLAYFVELAGGHLVGDAVRAVRWYQRRFQPSETALASEHTVAVLKQQLAGR